MTLPVFQHKFPVMLGIDISTDSVKLLEISHHKTMYRVERYLKQNFPTNAIQERDIKDIDTVGLTLRDLVKNSGTKLKHAAVAVSGKNVLAKIIPMSKSLNEKALEKKIFSEVEHYFSLPIHEVNLDFQILGPSLRDPNLVDVLVAVIRTEKMNSLLEAFSIAELIPKIVDMEIYALVRALYLMPHQFVKDQQKLMVGIVDIGSTKIALHVLHNAIPVYTQEKNVGMRQLIDEIMQGFDLTLEEATFAIKENNNNAMKEYIEPFAEKILQQVIQLLHDFVRSGICGGVHHLVLTGGGAALPTLTEKLNKVCGIATFVADPFEKMSIAPTVNHSQLQQDASSLMICAGLAIRSFMHDHSY